MTWGGSSTIVLAFKLMLQLLGSVLPKFMRRPWSWVYTAGWGDLVRIPVYVEVDLYWLAHSLLILRL